MWKLQLTCLNFFWNIPKKFQKVVIYLGDIHFLKENFGVVKRLITASGIRDIVFPYGISSTGSIMGTISESHYNRAWVVQTSIIEALEGLCGRDSW